MNIETSQLQFVDTFELMEALDRLFSNLSPNELALRDEIRRRLQFAEDNGVTENGQ